MESKEIFASSYIARSEQQQNDKVHTILLARDVCTNPTIDLKKNNNNITPHPHMVTYKTYNNNTHSRVGTATICSTLLGAYVGQTSLNIIFLKATEEEV